MANATVIRALRLRATRADACGVLEAEATANSRVTTNAFVSASLATDVFTSTDIQVVGADGGVCARSKGRNTLQGFDVTLTLCNYNEALLELLLGMTILTDYAAPVENVGGVIAASGTPNPNVVALELFPENGNNDACATGGGNPARPYLHYVLPKVTGWELGGTIDFGDAASTITLTGYAEPSTTFTASRAVDEWTAADLASIQNNGLLAYREITAAALPAPTASGYDA